MPRDYLDKGKSNIFFILHPSATNFHIFRSKKSSSSLWNIFILDLFQRDQFTKIIKLLKYFKNNNISSIYIFDWKILEESVCNNSNKKTLKIFFSYIKDNLIYCLNAPSEDSITLNDYFKRIFKGTINIYSNQIRVSNFSSSYIFPFSEEKFLRLLFFMSSLEYIKIRVHTHCNYNCDMCMWKDKKDVLKYEIVKKVLDEAHLLNIKVVNFTGGEPTIYYGIRDLVKDAKSKGFRVSISTNGAIGRRKFEEIREYIDLVEVSLDSPYSYIHDRIRGVKGAFRRVFNFLRFIRKSGIPCEVNVTLRPDNYKNIYKIIPLVYKYCVSLSFQIVDTTGLESRYLQFNGKMLEEIYTKEIIRIFEEANKYKIKTNIQFLTENFFSSKERGFLKRSDIMRNMNFCSLPKTHIRINSDGSVSPCCWFDGKLKVNISESSLINALISNKYFLFIKRIISGKYQCKVCKGRMIRII